MATGSSASFGLQYHVRSISLPSRLNPKIEAEIHKLTSSFSTIAPSCSTETTTIASLVGLADRELYTFAEQLIQYPQTQQAILRRYQHGVLVEEALEDSVGLLDWCGRIRELFITMKEQVRDLQSALRRKSGDERNISAYISFRKKVKKDVSKSLRALKHMENKLTKKYHHLLDDDHHLSIVIFKVLREATAITISVFRSLLIFLSCPASQTKRKPIGWSLISKLMMATTTTTTTRPEASERRQVNIVNKVGMVDFSISSLHGQFCRDDSKFDVQMAQRRLQDLDSCIEAVEARLDCLYRRLIQSRVSLLNILTH